MTNKIILIALLFHAMLSAKAQTMTINGIALDKGDRPILGCNPYIKGTPNGTSTNLCGEFKLTTNEKEVTVVFSCLTDCLRTFEVAVKNTDFKEGDQVIFHLRGHSKLWNRDCKKKIRKDLKKYTID